MKQASPAPSSVSGGSDGDRQDSPDSVDGDEYLQAPNAPQETVEARLAALEGAVHRGFHLDARTSTTGEPIGGREELPGAAVIFPAVRWCNLAQFKNRVEIHEGRYAVDVLEDSPSLAHDAQVEITRRESLAKHQGKGPRKIARPKIHPQSNLAVPGSVAGEAQHIEDAPGERGGPSNRVISRVRIQSPTVLAILSKRMQEPWSDGLPRTFCRPFTPLIHYHDEVKAALREMETPWSHADRDGTRTPLTTTSRADTPEPASNVPKVSIDDSLSALAELQCYVKFIDTEILPLYEQFKHVDHASPLGDQKIRFQDLWYLFRTGELVYRFTGTEGTEAGDDNPHRLSDGQRTWRVYGTKEAWPKYRLAPTDRRQMVRDEDDDQKAAFRILCYYIDYDGEEFCCIKDKFEIKPYEGERPITSLKVCPFRFIPDHEKVKEMYTDISKGFLGWIETKHATYDSWTVTHDPRGMKTTDQGGSEVKRAEQINSEVIVDFLEAFQACPSWKPQSSLPKLAEPRSMTVPDDLPICSWSDPQHTNRLGETTEIVVAMTGVTTFERNRAIREEDCFLRKVREKRKGKTTRDDLTDEDLLLLPLRVFAYVLQDRKFVQLDSSKLVSVKGSYSAFDGLKIQPSYKTMIQGLVHAHFYKKSKERTEGPGSVRLTQDLIPGKGKGLFILLHGVPGVGKTGTAEAVAMANGKPLFPITCGDLGLTPTDVEAALRRIFRLANAWDCVLLLDEVDTFFSQRSKGDSTLAKNALVSVFLRVLEYYDGLLFLTTNRTGTLDEAFITRIHLKLYYGHLEHQQTLDIWAMNLERLRQIEKQRTDGTPEQPLDIRETDILNFADWHFRQATEGKRWNGRQIRNAFQMATSLAYFEARSAQLERIDTPVSEAVAALVARPKLDVRHFQTIHAITDEFDEYLQETTGRSASRLAFEKDERSDHFKARPSEPAMTITPPDSLPGHHRGGSGGYVSRAYDSESNYRFESATAESYTAKPPVSLARPVSPSGGPPTRGLRSSLGSNDLGIPVPQSAGLNKRKLEMSHDYDGGARHSRLGGSYPGFNGYGGEWKGPGKDGEYP